MMKLHKLLLISAGALLTLLGVQIIVLWQQEPRVTYHAAWAVRPKSVAQVRNLASQIVRGRVIKVERAQDLTVKAPGEPGGVDRIPIEVVTLALEGAYKGRQARTVQVFHTGLSPLGEQGHKMGARPKDGKHGGRTIRPGRKLRPTARERNSFILDDDPGYRVGEQYLMFLTRGPRVRTRRGRVIQTLALVAPEGRYQVTAQGRLQPVSRLGFAVQLRAKPLTMLERQLPRFNALPVRQWHPQLQRLKLQELQRLRRFDELKRLQQQLQGKQGPLQRPPQLRR